MEELIKKYPWIIATKNLAIGVVVLGGLVYFTIISANEAKKNLQDIFTEEKSDITLVEDVLATGYEFDEKNKLSNNRQLFSQIWELESKTVEQKADSGENIAKQIEVLKIYKEGRLNILGYGDEASYNKEREELKMTGNVRLESEDGTTKMTTDILIWRDKQKEFSCPKPVDIRIDDNHVLSDMLFGDKDMERIDFLGRVSMYVVGVEKENFLTKEGYIDLEEVKIEGERDPDDVINIECEYVHYDKTEKYMECYPYIPHTIRKKYQFYLREEEFQPLSPLKYQPRTEEGEKKEEAQGEELKFLPEDAKSTGLEGFEDVFKNKDASGNILKESQSSNEKKSSDGKSSPEEGEETARRRASIDPEPFPGMFPERLKNQVYCWKQNKKIFSNRLDIELKKNLLKPRFDAYIWAFDFSKETMKKFEKQGEEPSKTLKALSKSTTEIFGDFINVFWKTDFIDSWGGVEVRQKEKLFTCENMVYSDDLGVLQADGDVFIEQFDGAWLEKEGLLEDVTDEKAKEDAKKPTKIWSDAMISYDEQDYIYMTGDVYFKQEEQNMIADEGEFSDEDDILILTGNVRYRNKDGERIDADKMTIYTEENRYIAEGTAVGRSLIPEKYEKEIKEVEKEKGESKSKKKEEKKPEGEEGKSGE